MPVHNILPCTKSAWQTYRDEKCPVLKRTGAPGHFSNCLGSLGDLEFLRKTAYAVSGWKSSHTITLLLIIPHLFFGRKGEDLTIYI